MSDAATEASKKPEEKEKVVKAEPPDETADTLDTISTTELAIGLLDDGEPAPAVTEAGDIEARDGGGDRWHFGAITGFGYQSGDDFNRYGVFGLNIGNHDPVARFHFDLGLVYKSIQTKPGSFTAGAIKDEREGALDLGLRYYLTPGHTFSGIYLFGGARYGALAWKWATPIEVESGGGTEEIKSDLVGFFTAFVGLGVSLVQTSHFKIGVNASGGFKLYHSRTLEGFENDLFGSSGIAQIMFPIVFGNFD